MKTLSLLAPLLFGIGIAQAQVPMNAREIKVSMEAMTGIVRVLKKYNPALHCDAGSLPAAQHMLAEATFNCTLNNKPETLRFKYAQYDGFVLETTADVLAGGLTGYHFLEMTPSVRSYLENFYPDPLVIETATQQIDPSTDGKETEGSMEFVFKDVTGFTGYFWAKVENGRLRLKFGIIG